MSLLQPRATQSRPPLHGTGSKQFGIFKKLVHRSGPSESSYSPTMMAPSHSSNRSAHAYFHRNRWAPNSPASSNLMEWLQAGCPQDVLPLILSFAGPQKIATISQTNKFWHGFLSQERTWQTLCQNLYKWKDGDDIPESWREFYRSNPCVPVDYPTVSSALATVTAVSGRRYEQRKSIRILLRPGRYGLREPILIQAEANVHIILETMEIPESFHPVVEAPLETESKKRKKSAVLKNCFTCRTVDVEDEDEQPPSLPEPATNSGLTPSTKRATLMLRSKRHNEPIVRIRQGFCTLRNLELRHISYGTDIWNGNSAVQIQPPIGYDDQPIMVHPPPSATLDHVEITSGSGRGIVNIDGGLLSILNCYIHDCAATGIYVGGPGSRASIENTDVVRNGNGNSQHRRGIARGHSGIYLEQGHAKINNCNISENSLSGISAISPVNAILHIEESSLVSNGSFQLEMPDIGTAAHRQSSTRNLTMSTDGLSRSRSGLMMAEE